MNPTERVSETLDKIIADRRTRKRTSRYTMRWILAHDPPAVFEDASREFMDEVREKTHGEVEVELYSTEEFVAGRGGEEVTRTGLVQCLARGEVEMAHTYVAALGNFHDKLWAMELPFLFRDYDHADAVLEGPIAERFMHEMIPVGIRGLAFAYSGGFRITPAKDRTIRGVEDYEGLRIRTSGNPVPEALYARLGAHAVAAPLQAIAPLTREGEIDAAEVTYVRFLSTGLDDVHKVINDTGHSLFMTMLVVNERFFQSLPEVHQAAIVEAGRAAGKLERIKSIEEEERVKTRCSGKGVEIVTMSPQKHDEFRETALKTYEQFAPIFGEELIASIRDTD